MGITKVSLHSVSTISCQSFEGSWASNSPNLAEFVDCQKLIWSIRRFCRPCWAMFRIEFTPRSSDSFGKQSLETRTSNTNRAKLLKYNGYSTLTPTPSPTPKIFINPNHPSIHFSSPKTCAHRPPQ